MTKEELAARLNGREYGEEITDAEEAEAKAHGLLVIFGASDDLVELRGAIDEELGAYNGCTFAVVDSGIIETKLDDEQREVLEKLGMMPEYEAKVAAAVKVETRWCEDDEGFSWTYRTAAPHATFVIREEDQNYCRGIVIDLTEAAHG